MVASTPSKANGPCNEIQVAAALQKELFPVESKSTVASKTPPTIRAVAQQSTVRRIVFPNEREVRQIRLAPIKKVAAGTHRKTPVTRMIVAPKGPAKIAATSSAAITMTMERSSKPVPVERRLI